MIIRFKRFLKAFSLIEVSISLVITGIISSVCLQQLASFKKAEALRNTQHHFDVVITSLGAYYLSSDGDLPQPSGKLVDGFGRVPFETLGIMERFAKDGNGNWILFKVNPFFGKKNFDSKLINLGVVEFSSSSDDKVAFILKSMNKEGKELFKIWMSERNFKNMFKLPGIRTSDSQTERPREGEPDEAISSFSTKRSINKIPLIEDD